MLTVDQRAQFSAQGLLRLPAAVDPDDARQMGDAVREFLAARESVVRDDPSTWTTARPAGFNRLTRTGALDRLWSPTVDGVLSELLGSSDRQHRERPRVLLTFPQPDRTWEVPSATWHFDYTPLQERPGLRAVQVFALLSDVRPQGGGTLVLTGSQRLVAQYAARTGQEPKPRSVRAGLGASHPWLDELWGRRTDEVDGAGRTARFLDVPVAVDGVEVCVTEVTGRSGDVYVMDSDCFHAIAPNTLEVPRVMCTSLVVRTST